MIFALVEDLHHVPVGWGLEQAEWLRRQ
jgi:hypothetical protein